MWLLLPPLLLVSVWAQETSIEPQPGMVIAQRLAETLPRLPNVISSQMEGKPEELRSMISHMLGDGLISQLVTNPLGVAEGMGVQLSNLGINKTDVEKKMLLGSGNSSALPLFPFTVQPPKTTTKMMYLDGVPIKDFDQFVRNRNLEDHFSTKQPPTTTTPIPSANDIAAAVYDKLKTSIPTSIPQPPATERKFPVTDEFSRNLDVAMIDPSRLQEVNTLLRRAPQRYENPLAHAAGPFMQTLDPEVDEVVTSLRTGSAMDVEEQELELQRRSMEIQLREQLNQWHNSFSNVKDRNSLLVPMDLPELSAPASSLVAQPPAPMEMLPETTKLPHVEIPKELPTIPTTMSTVMTPPAFSMEEEEEEEEEPAPAVGTNQVWPKVLVPPHGKNVRLAPRRSAFEQEAEDSDEFTSACECQQISLQQMKGRWSVALASKSLLEKVQAKLASILPNSRDHELSCSRAVVCVLKHSGGVEYEYMLVTNGNGPCREAALLVRNPDVFFDKDNSDLINYLKDKISSDELETLDIVPFANDCS
ncbi:unnamed protein product [Cylicocyclus nassatus]|uniref:Uncharacterized protein n=1 Tax=Cylicocyclus nassatus TaxID=53992 RepID=A0AA36MHS1_CYLNA|nr:unnamed protein product [Cylicocyclus nassatus]